MFNLFSFEKKSKLQVFRELMIIILRWIEEIHVTDVEKNYAEQS